MTTEEREGCGFLLVVAAGALILALLAQVLLVPLAYGLVPGRKSSDGPLVVLLAYPLVPIVALTANLMLQRSSGMTPTKRAWTASVAGAALVGLAAFASAFLARIPG